MNVHQAVLKFHRPSPILNVCSVDADVVDGRNDDRVDVGRLGEELP